MHGVFRRRSVLCLGLWAIVNRGRRNDFRESEWECVGCMRCLPHSRKRETDTIGLRTARTRWPAGRIAWWPLRRGRATLFAATGVSRDTQPAAQPRTCSALVVDGSVDGSVSHMRCRSRSACTIRFRRTFGTTRLSTAQRRSPCAHRSRSACTIRFRRTFGTTRLSTTQRRSPRALRRAPLLTTTHDSRPSPYRA